VKVGSSATPDLHERTSKGGVDSHQSRSKLNSGSERRNRGRRWSRDRVREDVKPTGERD
jgi:hypothetical protein